MILSSTKLSVLTFPQRWDGTNLTLRILVVPRENPLEPLRKNLPVGIDAAAFAESNLVLKAMLIPGLAQMPSPSTVSEEIILPLTPPTGRVELFSELAKSFKITQPSNVVVPPSSATFIQKYLPKSYRDAFAFSGPRTAFAKTDDSYLCAMKKPKGGLPAPIYSTDDVSWGKVIALVLRQPLLAEKLGMIYQTQITLPTADFYQEGGWLYVDLASTSDYYPQMLLSPELIRKYAARIPALSTARSLFAAVQFPVSNLPLPGNYDSIFVEAADFDDGFANVVHHMQPVRANPLLETTDEGLPPIKDFGIRLGWEDEQILIWQNRQLMPDPTLPGTQVLEAPMGVFAYRIDVREAGLVDKSWHSLMKVEGLLKLKTIDLGLFRGELGVEVAPTQLDGQKEGTYWLPSLFTQWTGSSLAIKDNQAATLGGTERLVGKQLRPVDIDKVPLQYGKTYDFRVRLADLTGGGPDENDQPVYEAPAPVTTSRFRRLVPPGQLRVAELDQEFPSATPKTSYSISRPLLGYPAFVFTGFPDAYNTLLADLPTAKTEQREVGCADPDVTLLKITVDVKAPEMDNRLSVDDRETYYPLYTTYRNFPADDITKPFELAVEFLDARVLTFGDATDLGDLPLTPSTGPITLPTARDIRINVSAVCKSDATLSYFGSEATRFGKTTSIHTRADSQDETHLFIDDIPARQFKAIVLQPDPQPTPNLSLAMTLAGLPEQTPANMIQRLAQALDLDYNGLTLLGKPGQRIIFGCAKEIRHTLAPDHSSISFASKAELINQWIPVLILNLNRDWSWDGLEDTSFDIYRSGENKSVGSIEAIRSVSVTALNNPDRSKTTLIFLDAVEPKPANDSFPAVIDLAYTVKTRFQSTPASTDAEKVLSMTVPVAVRPSQVPRIVSAGLAFSPYERNEVYSATTIRSKMLWIEFAEPVTNPDDAFFTFFKAYAPDPLLIPGNMPVDPEPKETAPYLDPELIRIITPGQSDDQAGLNAMQRMIPCDDLSPRHYITPLPPGLYADSPELFGFFTYEFCVGHAAVWSTAQARFGRSIRVTGLQHPAPSLVCTTWRDNDGIYLSAPFANPIYQGQPVAPFSAETQLWGLLYVQVLQADGNDYRNILLSEKLMRSERQYINRSTPTTIFKNGLSFWSDDEVAETLQTLGIYHHASLSVLSVETFPNKSRERVTNPLSTDLGQLRIYRTSQLEPVSEICCTDCT